MKNTDSQKLKLGLFVIIGTILFIIAIYLIGQKESMFKKTFTISAYFQNVNGLKKGNNVRYSGINIGTVNSIEMVNDSTIKVAMNIEEKIITNIKKNAIATIGSDGLVGNMIVSIIPGDGKASTIENGDIIKSYSKIGGSDILNTLNTTGENTVLLTAKLLKVADALSDGKGTFGVLLNDTIMAKDLMQSVENLKDASSGAISTINELNKVITSIQSNKETVLGMVLNNSVSGKKLKTIVSNLEASSKEIENVINNAHLVLNDLNSSQGTFNYIVKDTSLVNSLKSTLKNINEGTDKFNQNMEALKHNFLTRGYFKKLEREERKAKEKADN